MLQQYNNDKQAIRDAFKTPEGKYTLHAGSVSKTVPFQAQRSTRITVATLQGGGEQGDWLIYNVVENLHFCRPGKLNQEPTRTVCVASPATLNKAGKDFPTCHHFTPAARDNVDLVVGMNSGEVVLLSLRTQLTSTGGPKAAISGTYNMDGSHESNRCTAVAWLPNSQGTSFVAAYHTSGALHFYRKVAPAETERGKFSLGGGGSGSSSSSGRNPAPERTIALGGGGINDIAFSPDGTQLAVAARDGALRVLDVITGQVTCGFNSYYGGLLCCTFSPDGQYVAAGGEDDLVAMFSLADRCVTAWGEGHASWVCRLAFDAWHRQATPASHSELASPEVVYRLASVGADCALCLWDFVISDEYLPPSPTASRPGHMRKVSSGANLALGAGGSLSQLGPDTFRMPPPQQQQQQLGLGSSIRAASGPCLAPPTPRSEMVILQPIMQHRIHHEPLSDVVFLSNAVLTSCHAGTVRYWLRPQGKEVVRERPMD